MIIAQPCILAISSRINIHKFHSLYNKYI
jgi:hypothetical protein